MGTEFPRTRFAAIYESNEYVRQLVDTMLSEEQKSDLMEVNAFYVYGKGGAIYRIANVFSPAGLVLSVLTREEDIREYAIKSTLGEVAKPVSVGYSRHFCSVPQSYYDTDWWLTEAVALAELIRADEQYILWNANFHHAGPYQLTVEQFTGRA